MPDREVAADQEGTERLDHMARRFASPSCPWTSTTRVEATLSASRSKRGEQQDRWEG